MASVTRFADSLTTRLTIRMIGQIRGFRSTAASHIHPVMFMGLRFAAAIGGRSARKKWAKMTPEQKDIFLRRVKGWKPWTSNN